MRPRSREFEMAHRTEGCRAMTNAALAGNHTFEMRKRSRTMSPNGSVISRRRAIAISRSACRADRRPGGFMNCLRRRKSRRAFRGAAPIGSGATNGSCRTTIPTAIIGMARDAFLSRVPAPDDNIHAIPTEGLVAGASRRRVRGDAEALLRRRHARSRPAAVRRHAARHRRGRTHRLIVPRSTRRCGRRSGGSVAVIGANAGAAHHADLSGARQQPRCRIRGDRKRESETSSRAHRLAIATIPAGLVRPVGRLHWFTDRAAAAEGAN